MTNKECLLQHQKQKTLRLNTEAMKRGYIEMSTINFEIANEMYHLETESTYRIDEQLKEKM
ncbi:hypothetical protein P9B03_11850 [Metasolibacillus meyeri]|uniref:Fur-regulated basic protein FbpA n=1 Tax=Metasolibacillus meyeri TaxID=1071052 RepID=A0AAW9NK99_9BACL|nr:hypothetical protein [Metasolibacillus meyeri]MEC1179179.1 hypothetical protein [Metasolibacillus meyeri]